MPAYRSNTPSDAGALAVAAASIFALIVPVMRGDVPAGHDAPAHLTYTYLFDRALAEGQFPVRWMEWIREGHGQPLFNFYQPGLFYIVQAIHLAVPSLTASLKLTVLLSWWLGAAFVYLLCRRFGRLPAAAVAVLFAFSPYLILDVFVRCAYPELAGIAFGVGVLWALDGWLRTRRPAWLPALACLACLMLVSHPPTSLIFSPLFAGYVLCLVLTRQTTGGAVAALVPAALLGLGLAAFYIVPAIAELHLIRSAELTHEGYDYHRHFVFPRQWLTYGWGSGSSVEGVKDGMSFQIGIAQWVAIALAMTVVAADVIRRTVTARTIELSFWLFVAAAAMFFMTPASVSLWEATPALAFVQYPWRFLMLISIAAAAMSAPLLSSISNRRWQAALVVCVAVVQVQLTYAYLVPSGYITRDTIDIDWPDWRHSKEARKHAFIERGYYPMSLDPAAIPEVRRWTITRGQAVVREISIKGHEVVLAVTADEPTDLQINTPAFPGWSLTVDGIETPGFLCQGYLTVKLAPGTHRVRAAFKNTPVRTYANVTSLASGVILLAATALLATRTPAAKEAQDPGLPRADT